MNPNKPGKRGSYPGPGSMSGVLWDKALDLLPMLASVILWGLWLLLAPAVHPAAAASAQPVQRVDERVEAALLAENWAEVVRLLGPVDGRIPSPVVRLIQAHAYLALNRNNESFCLFRSVSSKGDRKQWQAWSHDFAARNSGSASAHYFKGDALARLGHWEAALAAFNRALELRPKHPLVLNARGVTYAARGQLDTAMEDFAKAARANPAFADAYANLGAQYIQRKTGADGALKWFERALDASPGFGLALNGHGGAQFVMGEWEKAQEDLAAAREKLACDGAIVEENLGRVAAFMNGREMQMAGLPEEEAGTTLDRRWENLKNNPSQRNTNRLFSDLRGQPQAMQNRYVGMLKDHADQNPQWGNTVNGRLDTMRNWNRPGGPGEGLSRLIPKSGGIGGGSRSVNIGGLGIGESKGNISVGGLGLQDHQVGVTRGNFELATRAQKMGIGTGNPGGGVTTTGKTHLDDGDWPVVTSYGLVYPVKF